MKEADFYKACIEYVDKNNGEARKRIKNAVPRFLLFALYDGDGEMSSSTAIIDPSLKMPCTLVDLEPGQAGLLSAADDIMDLVKNEVQKHSVMRQITDLLGKDAVKGLIEEKLKGTSKEDAFEKMRANLSNITH